MVQKNNISIIITNRPLYVSGVTLGSVEIEWGIVLNNFGSVDMGGHSLRTEKIFVRKTSSGFPEDINREDEVTLTSVSCVQPRLNAKTSWVQGNEEMSMCSISNGK